MKGRYPFKVYRYPPVLYKQAGPIGTFRLWAKQFYTSHSSADVAPAQEKVA